MGGSSRACCRWRPLLFSGAVRGSEVGVMDLAAELSRLDWHATTSPWPGYEVNRGYGVMNLPFSSGDLLGLRVFPQTDFGGYLSVWHRSPAGEWSQYVDRAPVEAGCPRAWGPALAVADNATIGLEWTGPTQLTVTMEEPELWWRLEFGRTLGLAALNALHGPLPLASWRPRFVVAIRERVAQFLGLGRAAMSGRAASGQHLVAVLRRMYWVVGSTARYEGRDLGEPVALDACPTIGGWPLPRKGLLAIGEAHVTTADKVEYDRLRAHAI